MRIYLASPIQGNINTIEHRSQNMKRGLEWAKTCRKQFPDVEFYSPCEGDDRLAWLLDNGKITIDDILEADFAQLDLCDGLFAYEWEPSKGITREINYAKEKRIQWWVWNVDDDSVALTMLSSMIYFLSILRDN